MKDEKIINPQKVYNAEEAAKVLDINEQTLLDYLRSGKIAAQKIGEWKILGRNLIDFLSNKTYMIVTKQGVNGTVEAKDKDELFKKLSTGHYGVLPIRGNMIPFTPENIKEIIEIAQEQGNRDE
jgi:phage antirepressor YoqD-like protein